MRRCKTPRAALPASSRAQPFCAHTGPALALHGRFRPRAIVLTGNAAVCLRAAATAAVPRCRMGEFEELLATAGLPPETTPQPGSQQRSRSRSRSPRKRRASRSNSRSRSRSRSPGEEQGAGAMGSEVRILPPWFCVCLTPHPASKDRFQWQIEEESNSQNFDTSEWLTSATGRRVAAQGGKQAALDIRRDPRAQERERETDRLSAAPRRSRI